MGHFVKWRGPHLSEGSPAIGKTIQHTQVGQAFRFGIWGGDGIQVKPNNPAVAQVNSRSAVEGSTNNIQWYETVGLREGHVFIEAVNPADNRVWDSFQLAVAKPAAAKVRPAVNGITYDYQVSTAKIGPNYNADLTLTMRVALVPTNGKGSPPTLTDRQGRVFRTRNWTTRGFDTFAGKFQRLIHSYWSEKFWLGTPAGVNELRVTEPGTGKRYQVNLHCLLKVVFVSTPKAQHRVPVVQADRTVDAGPLVVNTNSVSFRSDSTQLDQQDVNSVPSSVFGTTAATQFTTATHEVGHLLGLRHPFEGQPAAGLPGNSAYCVAAQPDCDAVMGMGNQLRTAYARPWQVAAAAWFNSAGNGYAFTPDQFAPSLTRLAPVVV